MPISILLINVQDLGTAFQIMLQGMLGIFVFMSIFYLLIHVLDRIYTKKAKNE